MVTSSSQNGYIYRRNGHISLPNQLHLPPVLNHHTSPHVLNPGFRKPRVITQPQTGYIFTGKMVTSQAVLNACLWTLTVRTQQDENPWWTTRHEQDITSIAQSWRVSQRPHATGRAPLLSRLLIQEADENPFQSRQLGRTSFSANESEPCLAREIRGGLSHAVDEAGMDW